MIGRVWTSLPLAIRCELREMLEAATSTLAKTRVASWRIGLTSSVPYDIVYIGRKECIPRVLAVLGVPDQPMQGPKAALSALKSDRTTLVSDVPIPGALKVPMVLDMVMPAKASYLKLLPPQKRLASSCRSVRVEAEAEIERIHRELLDPFAIARWGQSAATVSASLVLHLARVGRLDCLQLDKDTIAAHVGFPCARRGARYWQGCRFGYPEAIFSDPKRLRDTNRVNLWFQLRYAEEAGYDFYDIGHSLARPEGGLLQWKKRQGARLDAWGVHDFFWINSTRKITPTLLWTSPLFSKQGRDLVLNVGIPAGRDAEEIENRFRGLGFAGLSAVHLHAACEITPGVLHRIRSRFETATDVHVVGRFA